MGFDHLYVPNENVKYYVVANYAITEEYITYVPKLSPKEGSDLLAKGKKSGYPDDHPVNKIVLIPIGVLKNMVFGIYPNRMKDHEDNEKHNVYRFSYPKVENLINGMIKSPDEEDIRELHEMVGDKEEDEGGKEEEEELTSYQQLDVVEERDDKKKDSKRRREKEKEQEKGRKKKATH